MNTADLLRRHSASELPNRAEAALLLEGDPNLPTALVPEKHSDSVVTRAVSVQPKSHAASIGLCLASALRNRWVLYLGRREQFEKEPSEEAVHELRVATRRLMAQLDLFATVMSSRGAEKAYRALKRSMKALGRLRDIQVQQVLIEEQLDSFPKLRLLSYDLQRQERARVAAAVARVRALKVYKFEKWISLMFQDLAEKSNDLRQQEVLSAAVIEALQEIYAVVVKRRRSIQKQSPKTIHKTRVAFKKFRYLIEALSPGFTGFDERQFDALASYQRRMGRIQDIEIIQASLAQFVKKYAAAEELLLPFARHLQRVRARALISFMKQADRIFEFSPSAWKR